MTSSSHAMTAGTKLQPLRRMHRSDRERWLAEQAFAHLAVKARQCQPFGAAAAEAAGLDTFVGHVRQAGGDSGLCRGALTQWRRWKVVCSRCGCGQRSRAWRILPDADWQARIGRGERARIVREFERHAPTEAYRAPILWYNRIVPMTANVKGWNMTPSQTSAKIWPMSGWIAEESG
jgi:hypothetical protein